MTTPEEWEEMLANRRRLAEGAYRIVYGDLKGAEHHRVERRAMMVWLGGGLSGQETAEDDEEG